MAEEKAPMEERIAGVVTRLTALEEYVHTELAPKIDENTRLTATTSAMMDEVHSAFLHPENGVKVKNDIMFSAYTKATNGIDLIARIGNGMVGFSEKARKVAQAVFWVMAAGGGGWSALNHEKLFELIKAILTWTTATS
jgi:hypothetical protein